jgi:hypothetical protein
MACKGKEENDGDEENHIVSGSSARGYQVGNHKGKAKSLVEVEIRAVFKSSSPEITQ